MSLKSFIDIDALRSLILESIDEGVILVDEKGTIHYINHSAGIIFGESNEHLMGTNLNVYMKDPAILKKILNLQPFHSDETSAILEFHNKPNIVVECKTRAIEDSQGKKIVILFSEVHKSSKLLRAILDYSPNYVFLKDLSQRYLLLNKSYIDALKAEKKALHLKFNDLKENDIIGKTDSDIFPAKYAEIFSKDDEIVLKEGKTIVVEYNIEVNEKLRTFLTSKAPLYDRSGKIFALCGIASEISSMKYAEKKLNDYVIALENITTQLMEARLLSEQANIAKSNFLANISHELRTPLHGVIASATLLLNYDLNDKQQKVVNRIISSGNILVEIINRILDFTKIESDESVLKANPLELKKVIEESYNVVIDKARAKGLQFIIDIDKDLPSKVLGDFDRLQQIFLNLFSNSIRFTEKGYVKLRGFCKKREEDKALIRFEISDSGIGIPKMGQFKLFDKFYQVDSSLHRRHSGVGLGLAITKQLVSKMGGIIGLESEEGKGSTFWFEIPFLIVNEKNLK